MKTTKVILALLLLAPFAFAEFDAIPDYIRANLGAIQKYPKASNVLLWCKDVYTLNADGSQVYELHSFRYIPDEAGRDTWGDPHLAYIEGKQKLEILTARTYTRDGRKVEATPQNAYNPIVPVGGMDKAPDYADVRQMVVTFLGLENGSIAELHYRLTTAKPVLPWIEGRVYFREEWPVIARELTVTVPAGVTLVSKSDRGAPEPTTANGTYAWKMGEQSGYLTEDLQGHRILLPNVAFATAKDWSQVTGELKSRIESASAPSIEIPASLTKKLAEATSDEARLDAVKTWVRERFNRLEFEHRDFALTLRPVDRILQTGYGNSLELAVLVSKLANAADVSVQVTPMYLPDAPVPSLVTFHGALLNVKIDGLRFYCDPLEPRDEFTQADLLGSLIFDGDPEAVEPKEFHCRAKSPYVNLTLSIDDPAADTLRGHGTWSTFGEWGIYEKVHTGNPAKLLADLISLNGFQVDEVLVKSLEPARTVPSAVIDFAFHAAALDTMDGRSILSLALLDFQPYASNPPFALNAREFPQWIPLPGEIRLHLETQVPAGWSMEHKPATGKAMWDWSEGEVRCEIKDGRLIFDRKLTLAREWLAPSGWSGFRTWMVESGARARNSVVFGKE